MTDSFYRLALERYSVRDFSDKEVEDWKIERILEIAKIAPTAANLQPQKIYVVQSNSGISKLSSIRPIFGARLAFLMCYDDRLSWKNRNDSGKDSGDVDVSIVTTHMMLEATELSLGTCWIGSFNPKSINDTFIVDEHIHPVCILLVGYPKQSCKPSDKHNQRKEIKDTTDFL